jgi:hypothetical protein
MARCRQSTCTPPANSSRTASVNFSAVARELLVREDGVSVDAIVPGRELFLAAVDDCVGYRYWGDLGATCQVPERVAGVARHVFRRLPAARRSRWDTWAAPPDKCDQKATSAMVDSWCTPVGAPGGPRHQTRVTRRIESERRRWARWPAREHPPPREPAVAHPLGEAQTRRSGERCHRHRHRHRRSIKGTDRVRRTSVGASAPADIDPCGSQKARSPWSAVRTMGLAVRFRCARWSAGMALRSYGDRGGSAATAAAGPAARTKGRVVRRAGHGRAGQVPTPVDPIGPRDGHSVSESPST